MFTGLPQPRSGSCHTAAPRMISVPTAFLPRLPCAGRARTVAIESEAGKIVLAADKLRSLLGYSNLRSALFEVHGEINPEGTSGNRLVFQGNGYGHGVGLCQFGARKMAKKGAKCDEILSHYFPGSVIRPCVSELVSKR